MAHIGHPILGDLFYSPPSLYKASNRLLLHSEELKMKHPITNDEMIFNAPCPFSIEEYDSIL